MLARLPALVLVGLALAACSPSIPETTSDAGDEGPASCGLGFLGVPSQSPVLELTALGADSTSKPLVDGADAPLLFPPQGGRVIFVGVKAKNVDPCAVTITGAIRDPKTSQARLDGRTINLRPMADGWGASVDSDIASFANIPVCPNQWASTDAYGNVFEILVTLKDRGGRQVTTTVKATPTCAEPDMLKECLCICKHGYVLGQSCDADAGADASADGA